jgi:cytochrome P450
MVMMSEKVFPDPFKFDPERWLGNKELRKYQVAFSKGKRACLGIK